MTPRNGETIEEYRLRDAAAHRDRHMRLKQTTVDGQGNTKSETYVAAGRPDFEVVHVPDPAFVARTSTLYGADGEVRAQWVIEKPEDQKREIIWKEYAKAMAEAMPPAAVVPAPLVTAHDLLAVYPVGDHHMGMLSWDKETGTDYDLKIGEKLLGEAMVHLSGITPAATQALVVFLGDFMHYDSFDAVTPTSRNILDSDGRYPKMVRASVRTVRHAIELAALRHGFVHVIVEIGNHDLASMIFMMELLREVYATNPRITIDTAPGHFHYYDFGQNLIGVHHGHGTKPAALPGIMAHDQAKLWGSTRHRRWLTGHIHSQTWYDFPGCSVESFRILPPSDAWAYNKGYRAERTMQALVFHREHGEVARHSVNPAMLLEVT